MRIDDDRRVSMKLTNSISLRNLTFSKYDESEFDERQLEVLNDAINKDIDMSKYANPIYDEYQLKCILDGLENGINVKYYHKPIFSDDQMKVILAVLREFEGTKYEENIELLAKHWYTATQMKELVHYIREPYAKALAKLKLSYDDLREYIKIIEKTQWCYDVNDDALDFAVRNINRWRDNKDEISE